MKDFIKELDLLVRSRYPLISVLTFEEVRAEQMIRDIARAQKKRFYTWSQTRGFSTNERDWDGCIDPFKALMEIHDSREKAIFVMKDFHHQLETSYNPSNSANIRALRDLGRKLKESYRTVIFLSPVLKIPHELDKEIAILDMPLPGIRGIADILKKVLKGVKANPRVRIEADMDLLEKVVKAARGLTAFEAERVFCKAVISNSDFCEDDLPLIINEKKQIVRKAGLLEYFDFDETISQVGGLGNLKHWLNLRNNSFTRKAIDYGLPAPKGVLLLGVQGCGKSLVAKAIGSFWKLPILKMDVGAIFSSFIGKSEENMRRAIKIAESISPAVLWLDELEKAFGGAGDVMSSDSGTTKRVFGTFLTWMQEKKKPVFVVATSNAIEQLPPELLRKGRFDEIFFVDLPSCDERKQIYEIHLKKRRRDPEKFDLDLLSKSTEGFSGAEIEETVISAMYSAFPQERDITTEDILSSADETVPLSETSYEKIKGLRDWAKNRTRPAS